jgi:glutathione S-transferase
MKLYYMPGSCAMATHIVINETAAPVEVAKVDRETRTAADGENYRDVNPLGYVPALKLDDGTVLLENAAILPYVGDLKPASGWMPQSGPDRYRALEWLGFVGTELHGSYRPLFAGLEGAARDYCLGRLRSRYGLLDGHLGKMPFLLGDRPSVADAYLYVVTRWPARLKIDLGPIANVSAFMERMRARPAVQKTIAEEGLPA